MKKTLIITAILCFAALTLGCSTTEPVDLNADDVVYGTEGKTVGDTLDEVKTQQGTKPHTHKASEVSDFTTAVLDLMGVKVNVDKGNPLNHDRYGDADLQASATVKGILAAGAALDGRVKALEGGTTTPGTACPSGYTSSSVGMFTVCKKGLDEMVKVGDFWVDRYESSLHPKANCTGTRYTKYSTFPAKFNDTGKWADKVYACSYQDITRKITAGITYHQAQMACLNVDKHLCTNAEWQQAAAGTDPKTGNFTNNVPSVVPKNCTSTFGVMHMVGNAAEWVSGLVLDGTTTKAMLRGGAASDTTSPGIDYIKLVKPSDTHEFNGARCCISGGR